MAFLLDIPLTVVVACVVSVRLTHSRPLYLRIYRY